MVKRRWETDEEYQGRVLRFLSKYNSAEELIEGINKSMEEEQKIIELDSKSRKKDLQEYRKTHPLRAVKMGVTPLNSNTLRRDRDFSHLTFQSTVEAVLALQNIEEAKKQQELKVVDKWKEYKLGIEAGVTAVELSLSGASLLGAYANYKKWATSAVKLKRGIANFLLKKQFPMQVTGTLIDAGQAANAVYENDTFDTYWNIGSAILGTSGSIGASDVFRRRYHSPRIDAAFDAAGVIQNLADFIKFGYDKTYNDSDNFDYTELNK